MTARNVRSSLFCAFYLCLTIFFVWFWTNNLVLAAYNLQLTSLIVLGYFVGRVFGKRRPTNQLSKLISPSKLALDINTAIAVLLLIVSSTGGLNSSLFFLTYFLLFATALIFEAPTTLIMTIAIALFFGQSLTSTRAAIQLSSLLLFSPLAIYFGKQYTNLLMAKQRLKQLNKEGQKMSKEISKEETLILPWLSLNFKNSMIKIVHLTSEMLTEIGSLKPRQQEKLNEILADARALLKSGEELKAEVDKTTDD